MTCIVEKDEKPSFHTDSDALGYDLAPLTGLRDRPPKRDSVS